MPKNLIVFEDDTIKMPYRMVLNDKFISLFNDYELVCNILEIIPFREKEYLKITESTPLNIFIQELDPHEN